MTLQSLDEDSGGDSLFVSLFTILLFSFVEPTDQMISEEEGDPAVKDKYNLVYILFYGLGTVTLVSANFFTTATDYWMYKFRDPSNESYNPDNRTGLQAEFTSDYSIVANVSNVIFLVVTIALIKKIGIVKRIIGALCGAIIMFLITCMFVAVNTDSWQKGFFAVTLVIGFFLTGFCAIFMVSLFQMVARFPPGYLAAILSGQSICGIFAALVQIFSLSIGASSATNGMVYFSIGMFFIFLTLIGFLMSVMRSEFLQYQLNQDVKTEAPKMSKQLVLSVLNKIKYYMISMIIVLGCSIMLHPGVLSLIVSMDKGNGNKWNDVFFVPVTAFLLYFVFDYLGREVAGYLKRPTNGLIILAASIVRIALVPMLMLCNEQPREHLPVVFNHDYVYIIFIIIFGCTNGYLVNLCVIQVPRVTSEEEKPIASILIVLFMLVSLGACSFLSALMVKAL